jgi:hypothetical protein
MQYSNSFYSRGACENKALDHGRATPLFILIDDDQLQSAGIIDMEEIDCNAGPDVEFRDQKRKGLITKILKAQAPRHLKHMWLRGAMCKRRAWVLIKW